MTATASEPVDAIVTRRVDAGGARARNAVALAFDQAGRAKLLIAQQPELAAKILGCAIDSVILVDGGARHKARQEMLRLARLVRSAHPHLVCE